MNPNVYNIILYLKLIEKIYLVKLCYVSIVLYIMHSNFLLLTDFLKYIYFELKYFFWGIIDVLGI